MVLFDRFSNKKGFSSSETKFQPVFANPESIGRHFGLEHTYLVHHLLCLFMKFQIVSHDRSILFKLSTYPQQLPGDGWGGSGETLKYVKST